MREELYLWGLYYLAPLVAFTVLLFLWNLARSPALLYAVTLDELDDHRIRIADLENRLRPMLSLSPLVEECGAWGVS
jgi:hypothetical protein